MSARIERLRIGEPLLSRAVMLTRLCEAPSCVRTSGDAEIAMEVAYSDGPDSGGASWLFIVHALPRVSAAATAATRHLVLRFMTVSTTVEADLRPLTSDPGNCRNRRSCALRRTLRVLSGRARRTSPPPGSR